MIYRGPGFLAVVLFAPSRVSKLDRRHKGRPRKRDTILTGEGGGEGVKGAKSYDVERAWSSINYLIVSGISKLVQCAEVKESGS
jgi:hypothetical protein